MSRKIRIGLLFGGQSGEHEVSLASAASVLRCIDRGKYDVVGIGVTREGHWLMSATPDRLLQQEVRTGLPGSVEVLPDVVRGGVVPVEGASAQLGDEQPLDIVFPLLHGPQGEDGTVQGLLELAGVPYVGSGVLGSAVAMDKATMKSLFAEAGLAQVAYRVVRRSAWERDRERILAGLLADLPFPVFVKPCNMGSSVGISRASDDSELQASLDLAARFDTRLIVEQGVAAREVECAVMGNDDPLVSVPGEVVSHHEFYDYEAKYTDGLADLRIPADLDGEQARTVQKMAATAFQTVDASGLARVDFFVRHDDGAILVNEINTMPGFTSTSMYPKLWEASGVPYPELIDRLVAYAMERHADRRRRSLSR